MKLKASDQKNRKEVFLVNFKVNEDQFDQIKKNAREYTKGNLSALIRFGALHPSEELKKKYSKTKGIQERLV